MVYSKIYRLAVFGTLALLIGSNARGAKRPTQLNVDQTVCISMMSTAHTMAAMSFRNKEKSERVPAEAKSPDSCKKDAEKVVDLTLDFGKTPSPCKDMMVTDVSKKNRKFLKKVARLPSGQLVPPNSKETLAAYMERLAKAKFWDQCVAK